MYDGIRLAVLLGQELTSLRRYIEMKNVAMRLGLVMMLVAALGVLAFSGGSASAADNSISVTMHAQNGSGEDGTATITAKGDADVTVVLKLTNGMSVAQPAHIHKGTCANLDPKPLYPLTSATNGASTSEVMVSLAELEKGGYAINVHKSAAEASTYVSCGDISAMMMNGSSNAGSTSMSGTTMSGGSMSSMANSSMPATGAGDQPLFLALLAMLALGMAGAGLKLSRSARR
jgi:hypothetical protein